MPIHLITGNQHKFNEFQSMIPDLLQLDIDLPEIQEVNAQAIVEAKLQEAMKIHHGPILVEDTSLTLDCLNGLPGPLVKWFMKTIGNQGLYHIAKSYENFGAVAKTLLGYADEQGNIRFFEGTVRGFVIEPSGESGFGWDPIFMPEGHTKTFAQMLPERKQSISMRQKAAKEFLAFLGRSV